MTDAIAIRRAGSTNNRFRLKVRYYSAVDLTFQSLVTFDADDIRHRNLGTDRKIINVPSYALVASSVPSNSSFQRNSP